MRVLAVGAHPDDIEFGCGGVLLGEAERGSAISLLVCSRGESGTHGTPAEREAETRRAAGLLHAESLEFLDLGGDAHLEATNAHALLLARHIRRTRPHVVLAPTTERNQHPDHAAVGSLCRDAARFARYGKIAELLDLPPHAIRHFFHYAITPGAEPAGALELRIDVGAQFQRWIELMECHATQMRTRRYVELQTARARLLGLEAGVEYATALFPVDPFLVRSLAEIPASVRLF